MIKVNLEIRIREKRKQLINDSEDKRKVF